MQASCFMKSILVTGGAGFIGSNFVNLLRCRCPGDRIVVLDVFSYAASPDNFSDEVRSSPLFELVRGDVRDVALVDELVRSAYRVVHFAAESHVSRSLVSDRPFFEVDVMGTQAVAAAVSRNLSTVERFVHISTSEVYGTAARAPMDEDHPLNPCTPYAAAKAGADRLVYAYRETYKIPTVIIRPFNNYGPRQHVEKLVPRFITSALLGEDLTVHGDGQMTRDWIFVEDTCEAIFRALFTDGIDGSIFNVGTGYDISVEAIGRVILDLVKTSRSKMVRVEPRPGQVDRHISSTFKTREGLGWTSKVGIMEGMKRTVQWYVDNEQWWRRLLPERQVDVGAGSPRGISGSF